MCFYYFLPEEFKYLHHATPMINATSNFDPETGFPKSSINSNGHANGYGGWEADEGDEVFEMPGSTLGLMRDHSMDLDGTSAQAFRN